MQFDSYNRRDDGSDGSPPSEAWLFAQEILGRPASRAISPQAQARAKRAELERLATFSSRHASELRDLDAAAAAARYDREILTWAAGISTRAEEKLRALQQQEHQEREGWRRAEQFYEAYDRSLVEWNEANHPRQPTGTSTGGQFAPKGGGGALSSTARTSAVPEVRTKNDEGAPNADPKARHLRPFDEKHDLSFRDAIKNGNLSPGKINRIKFTDDEVKQILQSAKPNDKYNLAFYTAENLPARLRAQAEKDFADLPGDEKYAMQAFLSNQARARTILMVRNGAFQKYVSELYGLMRDVNPVHFTVEKGIVVATGKEPVLGGDASRLDALKEMLIYLALTKGVSWGTSKISKIVAGPETAGDITIGFKGGGTVTIPRGVEYGPENLRSAIERATTGEKVRIAAPPRAPRPSLTEVPHVSASKKPQEFRRWFNDLTPDELATVWKDPRLRKEIEHGLRWPGGEHEWLMIARAPKLKEWGLTAEQIAAMRSPTSQIRFKNPGGGHTGKGAMTTHNQILKIIDSSPDFATFKFRIQEWANKRLVGGADALPPGLRPD